MNTRISVALCGLCLLGGCTLQKNQVYVVSDTSLGIQGALNTAQTAGRLVIGYDRKFVAVVPKTTAGDGTADAMSTFNCTHVEIDKIKLVAFRERLATGAAAEALAANLPDAADTEKCRAD